MDKYSHWIGKLFAKINKCNGYAVTFGQTTYFSVSDDQVMQWWHVHENTHKLQYREDGWIKFLIRYIYQGITKGYLAIDYEIEARTAAFPFGGPPV